MSWVDMLARGLSRVTVVHRLPGRLRLHVPLLRHVPDEWLGLVDLCERVLRMPPGIQRVRLEPRTGNALVEYDAGALQEDDVLGGVRAALAWARRHRERLVGLSPREAASIAERVQAACGDGLNGRLARALAEELPDAFWS